MDLINDVQSGIEFLSTESNQEISVLDQLQLALIAGGIGDVVPA
jgi:hypothetical protein